VNIVFFGSGAFGLPTLGALGERHTLTAIVTQPDRPAGRGKTLTPTPVGAWAASHRPDLPLYKPDNANEPAVRNAIRAHHADAWVIIAFGQKLAPDLLADRFAINLHASLLPRWRGAAPINAAILAGDRETGNSVITLADRMDAGLVLGQSHRPIEPTQTAGDLHDLLAEDGPGVVLHVLGAHADGTLDPVTQEESRVTLAKKMKKSDGRIDFRDDADLCRCRVNGYSPWPGVTVGLRDQPLKILRADHAPRDDAETPGTIIDPASGVVACAPGTALRLLEVQPAGKKPMPWGDFARGRGVQAGEQFTDPPAT
jgi:methionyl-tRNA formyltransferase